MLRFPWDMEDLRYLFPTFGPNTYDPDRPHGGHRTPQAYPNPSCMAHAGRRAEDLRARGPAIRERAEALRELRRAGLRTYAFVGPMLPMDPERLVGMLSGAVDRVVLDRMNYRWRVRDIYHAHGLAYALEEDFFLDTARELVELFARERIPAEPTPRWAARLRRDSTGL